MVALLAACHVDAPASDERRGDVDDPVGTVIPARQPGRCVEGVIVPAVRPHHHHPAPHGRRRVAELFHARRGLPDDRARRSVEADHELLRQAGADDDVAVDDRRGRGVQTPEVGRPELLAVRQAQRDDLAPQAGDEQPTVGDRGRRLDRGAERDLPDHLPRLGRQRGQRPIELGADDDAVGHDRARQRAGFPRRREGPSAVCEFRARALG